MIIYYANYILHNVLPYVLFQVSKTDSTISRSCSTVAICDGYGDVDGYSCCEGDLCNSGSGVHSTEALKCYTCAGIGTSSVCYEGGTALEDEGSRYTSSCGTLDRCLVCDQRGAVNTNLSTAIHTPQHIPHALEMYNTHRYVMLIKSKIKCDTK